MCITLDNSELPPEKRPTISECHHFKVSSLVRRDDQAQGELAEEYFAQDARYHHFAVVRNATSEDNDDIQLYHKDFKEIVPSQTEAYKDKEQDIAKGLPQWSIKDDGIYILFYYRVYTPEDWSLGYLLSRQACQSLS